VQRLAGDKLATAPEGGEGMVTESEGPGEGEAGGAIAPAGRRAAPGEIASREDALRMLEQVARWFRRTEPHSPLAYTLEEAVRRGRMTLPELLAELMPDEGTRSAFLSSLGIRPEPPAEG
jgi:type VI secretion system protein ImpA